MSKNRSCNRKTAGQALSYSTSILPSADPSARICLSKSEGFRLASDPSDRVFLSKSEGFRFVSDPADRVFLNKSEGFRFVSDPSHSNLNAFPNLNKGFQIFRSNGKLKILKI